MEKVYVTLLVLLAACLINENAASSRRHSKMIPIWGNPVSNKRPQGHGSISIKGTAGGRVFRQDGSNEAAPASSKPTAADCKAAGFYPTPGTCTEFYRCVDWTGSGSFFSIFHFNCPAGTVFDDKLDICNHGWAAGRPECGGSAAAAQVTQPLASDNSTQSSVVTVTDPTSGVIVTDSTSGVIVTDSTSGVTAADSTVVTVTDTTTSTTAGPPGVFSLVCYADNKYRRHPLYCNKYYYCIFDGDVWNVPSFTCPEGLVFDEANQICTRKGERDTACKIAPYEKPKSVVTPTVTESSLSSAVTESTASPTEASPTDAATDPTPSVTPATVDTTTQKTWEVDSSSLFHCPAPGYYPFEGDCIRFYKCVETDQSKLKGLLYRCPEGFGYHEVRARCLKTADLPVCQRVTQPSHFGLRYDNATPIYPEDLMWFFKN